MSLELKNIEARKTELQGELKKVRLKKQLLQAIPYSGGDTINAIGASLTARFRENPKHADEHLLHVVVERPARF